MKAIIVAIILTKCGCVWSMEKTVDCSERSHLGLTAGQIVLPISDVTKSASLERLLELEEVACTMVARSIQEAAARNRSGEVLRSLPFVVRDSGIDGAAFLSEKMPGVDSGSFMAIQAEYLRKDRNVLMFVVGHELGHATLGHVGKGVVAKTVQTIGSGVAGLGAVLAVGAKRYKRAIAAGVATAAGAYATSQCYLISGMGKRFELQADEFGVRALAREVGLEEAKQGANSLFTKHDQLEDGCMAGLSAHPSSRERIEAIHRMQ